MNASEIMLTTDNWAHKIIRLDIMHGAQKRVHQEYAVTTDVCVLEK